MRVTGDVIEHCKRHIERTKAEPQKREALGRDTERLHRRLKTLEALLSVHERAGFAA